MLTSQQLATMTVRNVVFHDVPNQRGDGGNLVLATEPTQIDATRRKMLQDKLKRVLDSRSAYGIVFDEDSDSPVPETVRNYTASAYTAQRFVENSQVIARHLHTVQHGAVSAGLLCVIDVNVGGNHGVVLMKLEREAGAQLELQTVTDRTYFHMLVLENLVLTSGTKLYKTAAFLRTGTTDNAFEMTACDSQHRVTDSTEMARFWLTFLGCVVEEDARVTTSKFYNSTVEFINSRIDDPIEKTQMYESLHSELQSRSRNVVPRNFIRDYVPDAYQAPLREHLEARRVPLGTFEKNTQDIKNVLRRLTFISDHGVRIVAPEGAERLVTSDDESITVNDRLKSIGKS